MACLSAAERTAIEADIVTKQAQLVLANAALDEIITKTKESYKFDSGEGAQQAKQRKIDEYTKLIEWLESRISLLYRKLKCQGIVNINIRRKYNGRTRRGC